MKKLLAIFVACIMVVTLFAGCNTAGKATTVTACVGSEPKSIDPTLNNAVDGAIYIIHAFEGLTKLDKTGQVVAGVAESWTQNDDGTEFVFKLRDSKWSDGTPVKASDFVFSWRRAVNPATAAEYAYQLYYIKNAATINSQFVNVAGEPAKAKLGADGKPATFQYDEEKSEFVKDASGNYIEDPAGRYVEDENGAYVVVKDDGTPYTTADLGVEAVDEKTLKVTLEAPCAYFLELTAFPTLYPLNEAVVSKDEKWATKPETYIGNGPYVLESWSASEKLVFVKNENYYAKDTIIAPKIEFILMEDQNAMLAAFRNGDLLFSDDMPTDELPALVESGEAIIEGNLGTYFYVFNTKVAPFDNVKVRKALALAIDRQYLVEKITQGGQFPAGAFVPVGLPDVSGDSDFRKTGKDYYDPTTAGVAANIEEAKKLLKEAGYEDMSKFPVIELKYNTSEGHKKIAEYIAAEWKKNLGITVTLQNEEWAVFQTSRTNGNYQVARHGWLGDYVDPMTFLDMWITESGQNDAKWSNKEYDALIDTAKKNPDRSVRMKAMHDAENLLMADMPVMPIYFYTDPELVSPKLKGLVSSALGFKYFMWCTVTD